MYPNYFLEVLKHGEKKILCNENTGVVQRWECGTEWGLKLAANIS